MHFPDMISWATENYVTIFNWLISIVAIVIPLTISRTGKHKIVDTKNLFKGYVIYTIKIVFYQFAMLCIFWLAGNILRIPYSVECLSKKTYLICCAIASGLCSLIVGFNWAKQVGMLAETKKLDRICTIVLVFLPILLQATSYITAVAGAVVSRRWISIWVTINVLIILVGTVIISDHDFFEYQNVVLTLDDNTKYEIEPGTLHRKGNWMAVINDMDGQITKFQEERIRRVKYLQGGWTESKKAMKYRNKLFYCAVCFCYLMIIGVVSQFLIHAVVKPVYVAERRVCLDQGSWYQLDAVAMDPDAKELNYDISGSPAVSVSESGMVIVSSELPGDETVMAQITISDDVGNRTTVQVEVRR